MKRTPEQITAEIIGLVSELAALAGAPIGSGSTGTTKLPSADVKNTSGATGGIRLLAEEGKLDSPKQLPEIIDLLKQEGRHYSNAAVSMALLALVRERLLTRFKDGGEKNWKYAIRR